MDELSHVGVVGVVVVVVGCCCDYFFVLEAHLKSLQMHLEAHLKSLQMQTIHVVS